MAGLAENDTGKARSAYIRWISSASSKRFVFDELDMQREAANASHLRRNFAGSEALLYIPEVYWPLCKQQVMVMERVSGVPVDDIEQLKALGVDLPRLARRGVRVFYQQVFRDNLFHADMHPGNILVDASDPEDATFIALDFGIVASLTPEDLYYISENFMALFSQDYRRVAELHVEAGWVPADTRLDELEAAVRTVGEPNFTRPLNEVSFGELLFKLFNVARRFNLNIQPQLIMLQKTLLNIEGLGRELYPSWISGASPSPNWRRYCAKNMAWSMWRKTCASTCPRGWPRPRKCPNLVRDYLIKATRGELHHAHRLGRSAALRAEHAVSHRRTLGVLSPPAPSGFPVRCYRAGNRTVVRRRPVRAGPGTARCSRPVFCSLPTALTPRRRPITARESGPLSTGFTSASRILAECFTPLLALWQRLLSLLLTARVSRARRPIPVPLRRRPAHVEA